MGYAGVVNYKGLRIGGVSGIYKKYDYCRGHFESPPYDSDSLRSVYHYRQQEIFRLQQLGEQIDIIMSHDWPTDVHDFGNAVELIEFKPNFGDQIRDNVLGSPPLFELLTKLKPTYWFSGHLHCKFAAVIPHEDKTPTKFLGLDQCAPHRKFLQILDVDVSDRKNDCSDLQYDLEWLTILYTTKHLTHVGKCSSHMPETGNASERWDFQPTDEEKDSIRSKFGDNLEIPKNFERTVPPYDPDNRYVPLRRPKRNQHTIDLCKILGIDDPLNLVVKCSGQDVLEKSGNL